MRPKKSMKIKICGITNLEDAQLAYWMGATALGFIFTPSPRQVTIETAYEISKHLPDSISRAGVFVNPTLEEVCTAIERAGLSIVQLHQNDNIGLIQAIKSKAPHVQILKVVLFDESRMHTPLFDDGLGETSQIDSSLIDAFLFDMPKKQLDRQKAFQFLASQKINKPYYVAGGLGPENLDFVFSTNLNPIGLDVCSGLESEPGKKSPARMKDFFASLSKLNVNSGRFGVFGGRYVPDTLVEPLIELENAYFDAKKDKAFQDELSEHLQNFVGRETPLYFAKRLSQELGIKLYLKREDLAHTGAHKINNALGQILLARKMGKTRIVAETGAGQHGVATAAVAAKFGMICTIYMGQEDMARQHPNVKRMRLMGANVVPVTAGTATLKDAVSETMRDWVTNFKNTFYILGSALGPHPYPTLVRDFQAVIGHEARKQILLAEERLPDEVVACVGGGSNAIGIFTAFLDDPTVNLIGVEAGGSGPNPGQHAARFQGGKMGVFQGTQSYVLQDDFGQISTTHSISAGLDYAAVGPEHAHLKHLARANYVAATDQEALKAFQKLCSSEGILPALESSHALAYVFAEHKEKTYKGGEIILVNLSGRGDKDLDIVGKALFADDSLNKEGK